METLFKPIPSENKWSIIDFEPSLPVAVCVKRACLDDGQRVLMLSRLRLSEDLDYGVLRDFFEQLEDTVAKQLDFDGVMLQVQINTSNSLISNVTTMLLECPVYSFLLNIGGYLLVNIASDLWLYKDVKSR